MKRKEWREGGRGKKQAERESMLKGVRE